VKRAKVSALHRRREQAWPTLSTVGTRKAGRQAAYTARAIAKTGSFSGCEFGKSNALSPTQAPDRVGPLQCPLLGLILPAESHFHLQTATKLLKLLERVLTDFSKRPLKSLDNQADFDSAIRRFESSRPSQCFKS
jgi:hypothetical protein